MSGLVLCAAVGSDHVLLKPGAERRPCQGVCGGEVWVSPTTLAMGTVTLMCNDCGKAAIRAQVAKDPRQIDLRIAPGALRDDTPADRRRRNELEAHGFQDSTPEEVERLKSNG